jgi:hypothetical protein
LKIKRSFGGTCASIFRFANKSRNKQNRRKSVPDFHTHSLKLHSFLPYSTNLNMEEKRSRKFVLTYIGDTLCSAREDTASSHPRFRQIYILHTQMHIYIYNFSPYLCKFQVSISNWPRSLLPHPYNLLFSTIDLPISAESRVDWFVNKYGRQACYKCKNTCSFSAIIFSSLRFKGLIPD